MINDRILAAHLATIDAVIASTDHSVTQTTHKTLDRPAGLYPLVGARDVCVTAERATQALIAAESAIIEPGGFTVVPVAQTDSVTAFVQAYPSSLPDYADRTTARAVTPYTPELRAEDYRAIRDAMVFAAGLALKAVLEHRSIDLVARPHMPAADQETLTRIVGALAEEGIDAACHDWLWDYLAASSTKGE